MIQPIRAAEASTLDQTTGKRARYTLDMTPDGNTVTCIHEGSTNVMAISGAAGKGPTVFAALMARLEKLGYLVVIE